MPRVDQILWDMNWEVFEAFPSPDLQREEKWESIHQIPNHDDVYSLL